jgi:D-alanine-D-alanine ligase
MNKRVAVLMGGPSRERDISIKSGKAVCRALKDRGLDALAVELPGFCSSEDVYRKTVEQYIRSLNPDIVFIALHGEFGEDGTVQRILEDMNIPYTGSREEASRNGMDKVLSKEIFKSRNIPVPSYMLLENTRLDNIGDCKVYFKKLGSSLVIKPSGEGSSIGLSIVDSEEDFYKGVNKAFEYGSKVIIEEYVRGREITVGILENKPLPVVEIKPKRKFFDFEAKYKKEFTEYEVPADIETEKYAFCQEIALLAHKALSLRFLSRVDMILDGRGKPFVLEVNTIPGLTETSLLPKAALAAGISFEELTLKILESALW